MTSPSACNLVILAQNSMTTIERCTECGAISIHFGPFTMRTDEASLGGIVGALTAASARLNSIRLPREPRSLGSA